jgi:pimeloyl-ACP methyl ester carboxylesterase
MLRTGMTIIGLLFAASIWSQPLINYQPVRSMSAREVAAKYRRAFGAEAPELKAPISLSKVVYASRDPSGNQTTLSGLIAMPEGGAPKGLVLYFHGTTADRDFVPSRYPKRGYPYEAELAVLGFAAHGYAVAMPDYLGLGDHKGVHPYPQGKVNAWSGIDLVSQVRSSTGGEIGPDLFVTGYSEGGAVAMWAVRLMEEQFPTWRELKKAAPISGPYNLSGVQARGMLKDHSNPIWLGASVYIVAYTAYGIQKTVPGIDLRDYFVHSFATYIPFVLEQRLDDVHIGRKLSLKAWQIGEFVSLRKILKPSFQDALRAHDTTDPMVAVLAANDCHDWAPKTPMALYAVEDDFLVPKENALVAIEAMRKRGVPPDRVWAYVEPGRKYNHLDCVAPGIQFARRYFEGEPVPGTPPPVLSISESNDVVR